MLMLCLELHQQKPKAVPKGDIYLVAESLFWSLDEAAQAVKRIELAFRVVLWQI